MTTKRKLLSEEELSGVKQRLDVALACNCDPECCLAVIDELVRYNLPALLQHIEAMRERYQQGIDSVVVPEHLSPTRAEYFKAGVRAVINSINAAMK